ncbi:MAG TPA: prepilin-type N-terminal cleavage/methylation domain-containing protein [Rickettsiales bacterium]|nr:prepilin-type N-terminal cleavage/methylation domain-containing protein [Rickettsiales bacterium]
MIINKHSRKWAISKSGAAFTLIELSIVLVIIGLIVGGILTGRDLINAAETRAQISQIDKYQVAVRTFQGKYGYLPGDIPDPFASRFGFKARGTTPATGDGNGVLDGVQGDNAPNWVYYAQGTGENAVFWVDLSQAGLIDGSFSTASSTVGPATTPITGAGLDAYFPKAKIGNGTYVYVRSGGSGGYIGSGNYDTVWYLPVGVNFFGVTALTSINYQGDTASNQGIRVIQAYNIDKKIDDAIPVTGTVTIFATDWGSNVLVSGTAATCADARGNGGGWYTAATTNRYSTEINNGSGMNCGLQFQFQ